jgi:predicted esterase
VIFPAQDSHVSSGRGCAPARPRFARCVPPVSRAAAYVNLLAGLCLLGSLACAKPRALDPDQEWSAAPVEPAEPVAVPAAAVSTELEVPGFGRAVLVLPADRRRPRPVLIASHGAGDGPRWQCEVWGAIVAGRGFVLCPRGAPLGNAGDDSGYFFRDHHYLGRVVTAALGALRSRYGKLVDSGGVVYTGYSQGATMGALFAARRPETYSRMVLVEGGHREWDVATARSYRRGGGTRVLFVCGGRFCANSAQKSARWLERAGVEVRAEHVVGGGHTYGGSVAERLAATFDWVVAGDARWR